MVESDTVREIRLLSQEVYKGGKESPFAFGDLIGQLLRLTIADSRGYIVVSQKRDDNTVFVINGWNAIGAPILLNNGSYLLIAFTLYLDQEKKKQEGDQFLRVRKEYITHQLDEDGQAWTFRYDYDRDKKHKHPASHLQIRGSLTEKVLPEGKALERVHFPTRRISIESVLRMLIFDFNIPINEDEETIKDALQFCEKPFLGFAHES